MIFPLNWILFQFQNRNIGYSPTSIYCNGINFGVRQLRLSNCHGCVVFAKWTNSQHLFTSIAVIAVGLYRIRSAVIAPDVNHCRAPNAAFAIALLKVSTHGVRVVRMAATCYIWKNGFQTIRNVHGVATCVNMNSHMKNVSSTIYLNGFGRFHWDKWKLWQISGHWYDLS